MMKELITHIKEKAKNDISISAQQLIAINKVIKWIDEYTKNVCICGCHIKNQIINQHGFKKNDIHNRLFNLTKI